MGILTHRCTKGERCKRTKRINLLLETKIYSSSSVAAPFCSGKCGITVTIHLLVIRKKNRIMYKSNQEIPQKKASFIYLQETPPEATHLLALMLKHTPHYSILPTFQKTTPGAGDRHTREADVHPIQGDTARDSRTSLAPGPMAAQPTSSLLTAFAACFHPAQIWHFLKTRLS